MKRKKRLGKILRLGAIAALSLAIVIALIGFTIGPAIVAKRLNPTVSPPTNPIDSAVAAFHQTLTIADLHADALLWGRDLAKKADYGHVDLPRLIQGNLALGSDFDGSVRLPIDAANLVQITAALKTAGFTAGEIGKIMGLNVMRVLAQELPVNP